MASDHTPNYALSQWAPSDKVAMEDFNADNAKIDAALAALESGKAEAASLAALRAVVAGKGSCQVVTGQYTGYGQYGQSNPNSLTFEKPPVLVLVSGTNTLVLARGGSRGYVLQNGTSERIEVSWNGNSLSWYSARDSVYQMNTAGMVHYYVAFLAL